MSVPSPSIPLRPEFASQLDRLATAPSGARGRRARSARAPAARRPQPASWLVTRACLLLCTVGLLKLGLLASVGEAAYSERAERLAHGNWAERTAAWVIQPDPVTAAMRNDLARFAREMAPAL